MAIVQAGKTFTADELKQTAGALAAMLRDHTQSGLDLKSQLESWPDADLMDLGLAQNEIDAIKGFFVGDLPAIANLLQASTWIKQLIGLGV
jgi:hypothetical protein